MKKLLRKLALLPLFVGLIATTACNRDGEEDQQYQDDPRQNGNLFELPWSELTPAQQKVRLEQESIDFLNEMTAISNDPAIDAIRNLERLFGISSPNVPDPIREVSNTQEVLNLRNVMGIFEWNSTENTWTEESSDTELRFVFPATRTTEYNNATLTVIVHNSPFTFEEDGITVHLPQFVTATLTINGNQAGLIEFGAEYNANEVPQRSVFRMVTNDGYEMLTTVNTRAEEIATFSLRRNNNSLLEGRARTDMDGAAWENLGLDALDGEDISEEEFFRLMEEADATVQLMNNLTIVYWIDSENYAREMDALWTWESAEWDRLFDNWDWNRPWEERRQLQEQLDREVRNRQANIMNEHMRSALVSLEDNFRIAELVARTERREDRWGSGESQVSVWYEIVYFLRFNNGVYHEASVYFGDGFDRLIDEWNDFVNRF